MKIGFIAQHPCHCIPHPSPSTLSAPRYTLHAVFPAVSSVSSENPIIAALSIDDVTATHTFDTIVSYTAIEHVISTRCRGIRIHDDITEGIIVGRIIERDKITDDGKGRGGSFLLNI